MTERFNLVVATPCFGGQVSTIYATSLFNLQQAVQKLSNVKLKVHLRDGDALITRARANLVTLFLDDAAATHLYVPGLKLHMRNALRYGATTGELMEVLEMVLTNNRINRKNP